MAVVSLLRLFPRPSSSPRFTVSREISSCCLKNSVRFCFSTHAIGSSQLRCDRHDKAYTNIDETREFERGVHDLFTEIRTKLEEGNKEDTIDLLQANYELVKEEIENGYESIEQASILDILALGYMGVGDVDLVNELLLMLDDIVSNLSDGTTLLDTVLVHMGSIYAALGKFNDATLAYERSLKILERKFGKTSPYLVMPLMGMAKVFKLTGRTMRAIGTYHQAIEIQENAGGLENEELLVPLYTLGTMLLDIRKTKEAEACFSRILDIHIKVYGEEDGRTGMAMCSFAHALCARGRVDEAISMYKKGLQIVTNTEYVALDDDTVEKMRVDLAELFHESGREQEGRELLHECLRINERCRGLEHPSTVAQILNLATSHFRSKNFAEAERLLATCLRILYKTVGPENQALTGPMLQLSMTLYHMDRNEEAEKLALKALCIREDAFGKESLHVGEALDCLVSVQARLQKDDHEVLEKLQRILAIQEREFGWESSEVTLTLKKIMFYMRRLGREDEMLPIQRRLSVLKEKLRQTVPI